MLELGLLVLKKFVLKLLLLEILKSIFVIGAYVKDVNTGNIIVKDVFYIKNILFEDACIEITSIWDVGTKSIYVKSTFIRGISIKDAFSSKSIFSEGTCFIGDT